MQQHNPVYFASNDTLDWKILVVLHQGIKTLLAVCTYICVFAMPDQFDAVAGGQVRHQHGHYFRCAQIACTLENTISDILIPDKRPGRRVELKKSGWSAAMSNIRSAIRAEAGEEGSLGFCQQVVEEWIVERKRLTRNRAQMRPVFQSEGGSDVFFAKCKSFHRLPIGAIAASNQLSVYACPARVRQADDETAVEGW